MRLRKETRESHKPTTYMYSLCIHQQQIFQKLDKKDMVQKIKLNNCYTNIYSPHTHELHESYAK